MPKLGIISDTHGRLPDAVFDAFADVDTIIHAGDICAESVLWELESIAKTIAVLGNCDRSDYGSNVCAECHPVIGGVRIWVAHFPEDANNTTPPKNKALNFNLPKILDRLRSLWSCGGRWAN